MEKEISIEIKVKKKNSVIGPVGRGGGELWEVRKKEGRDKKRKKVK